MLCGVLNIKDLTGMPVPQIWVAKSASWYLNDHLSNAKMWNFVHTQCMGRFFQNLPYMSQNWLKFKESLEKSGDWFCSKFSTKLVLNGKFIIAIFRKCLGLLSNSVGTRPFQTKLEWPPDLVIHQCPIGFAFLPIWLCWRIVTLWHVWHLLAWFIWCSSLPQWHFVSSSWAWFLFYFFIRHVRK